mmetsp:Transcript_47289/g.109755  ORF Transcript_47289/g.109755 Transcript_47289/m.109755 type:complete len:95 (+) Transcript_47289:77-361(+)
MPSPPPPIAIATATATLPPVTHLPLLTPDKMEIAEAQQPSDIAAQQPSDTAAQQPSDSGAATQRKLRSAMRGVQQPKGAAHAVRRTRCMLERAT